MPEVALLHRNDAEGASAARLMQPRAFHVGNAGAFERVEQRGRAQETALEEVRMRRLLARRAREYRVVAVIDALDLDDGLVFRLARVVAVPLAEGPFERRLVVQDVAF